MSVPVSTSFSPNPTKVPVSRFLEKPRPRAVAGVKGLPGAFAFAPASTIASSPKPLKGRPVVLGYYFRASTTPARGALPSLLVWPAGHPPGGRHLLDWKATAATCRNCRKTPPAPGTSTGRRFRRRFPPRPSGGAARRHHYEALALAMVRQVARRRVLKPGIRCRQRHGVARGRRRALRKMRIPWMRSGAAPDPPRRRARSFPMCRRRMFSRSRVDGARSQRAHRLRRQ